MIGTSTNHQITKVVVWPARHANLNRSAIQIDCGMRKVSSPRRITWRFQDVTVYVTSGHQPAMDLSCSSTNTPCAQPAACHCHSVNQRFEANAASAVSSWETSASVDGTSSATSGHVQTVYIAMQQMVSGATGEIGPCRRYSGIGCNSLSKSSAVGIPRARALSSRGSRAAAFAGLGERGARPRAWMEYFCCNSVASRNASGAWRLRLPLTGAQALPGDSNAKPLERTMWDGGARRALGGLNDERRRTRRPPARARAAARAVPDVVVDLGELLSTMCPG